MKNTFSALSLFAFSTFTALTLSQAQTGTLPTSVPSEPPAMGSATTGTAPDVKGAVKMPKVMFVSPVDGATVPKTFTVKVAVEGMKVAKAGDKTVGTGHHHILVDAAPVKKGEAIPMDKTHLHLDAGQSEMKLTLPAGLHTLTLQFSDGAQVSYGEMMSQTIKITVQ